MTQTPTVRPSRTVPASDHVAPFPVALRIALAVGGFAGVFISAVLAAGHVLDLPVPCGGSRGCASVAAHASSKLWGIPIAFFGLAAYLTHLVLLGRPLIGRTARGVALMLSATGVVVSAGLLIYAQTVIGASCPWCIASGVVMAVLFVFDLGLIRREGIIVGPKPAVMWTLAVSTAVAIGVQAGRMERAAAAPPVPASRLATIPSSAWVDPIKSVGPTDAPVTIVMFADFWCPACRGAQASLLAYQKAHPKAVRVVYRHLPLWQIRGHETSKAAAALSEIAGERSKFWEFAHAVHTQPKQMTREDYLGLMQRLGFDAAIVEARLQDMTDASVIKVQREIEFADTLGINATPTFVVLVQTHSPVSASQRGLNRLLNSPVVTSILAAAQREGR